MGRSADPGLWLPSVRLLLGLRAQLNIDTATCLGLGVGTGSFTEKAARAGTGTTALWETRRWWHLPPAQRCSARALPFPHGYSGPAPPPFSASAGLGWRLWSRGPSPQPWAFPRTHRDSLFSAIPSVVRSVGRLPVPGRRGPQPRPQPGQSRHCACSQEAPPPGWAPPSGHAHNPHHRRSSLPRQGPPAARRFWGKCKDSGTPWRLFQA